MANFRWLASSYSNWLTQLGWSNGNVLSLILDFYIDFIVYWCAQDQLITSDVEFLVLASDGLWDVVSNQVGFKILYSVHLTAVLQLHGGMLPIMWILFVFVLVVNSTASGVNNHHLNIKLYVFMYTYVLLWGFSTGCCDNGAECSGCSRGCQEVDRRSLQERKRWQHYLCRYSIPSQFLGFCRCVYINALFLETIQ